MSDVIKNRYDFAIIFDCTYSNPNGDPDAGNMPRIDPETGIGIVTDVCIKRKIRNYVEAAKEDKPGYKIYIKNGVFLSDNDKEAFNNFKITEENLKEIKKNTPDIDLKIKDFMCENFYDIRTFGAVMTTFTKNRLNCGQIKGPVQISFAHSIDPVTPQEITITRCTVTNAKEAEDVITGAGTMGNKHFIPYGLYIAEGYISANLARKVTGFSEDDLNLLWEAILNMFELDHSSSHGKIAVRKLVIFKHQNELGNMPAHKLFNKIKITKKDSVSVARKFSDYNFSIETDSIPDTIECIIK